MRKYLITIISMLLVLFSTTAFAADNAFGLSDGEYPVELTMEGGTGKATVESATTMTINEGKAFVHVVWSSPNYDYMLVNGEKYLPVNSSGNSEFDIPVLALNEGFTVVGDTVAMSKPHEVEYTFNVSYEKKANKTFIFYYLPVIIVVIWQVLKTNKRLKSGEKNEEAN